MDINLSKTQRAQLELLSIHSGKSVAQLLTEAAEYLLDREVALDAGRDAARDGGQDVERCADGGPRDGIVQRIGFLPADELDARLAQVLRRGAGTLSEPVQSAGPL